MMADAVADAVQSTLTMPQLRLMQPQDTERWDAFVQTCPDATFFHRAGWQPVIERAFGHKTWFYFAEMNGQIQGVLSLCQIKSALFGHSLSSLPFCVYGGVAAISDQARLVLDQAANDLAIKLKAAMFRRTKAGRCSASHPTTKNVP